jgi:C-terminal peptidase prc
MIRSILPWLLATLIAATAGAAEPHSDRLDAAARQAWTITDLVLEKDLDPPARQEMLLHALKALFLQKKAQIPFDLSQRVSAVTTREQFAVLLAEAWPKDDAEAKRVGDHCDEILFEGLLGWRDEGKDRHFYLAPSEVKRHEMFAGNRYVGTGIQIRHHEKEKLSQIVVPFAGGPARKAGARPGDLIVAVDDKSMKGLGLKEVVERLQGEDGSKVSMTVRQPDENKTRRLEMVRSVIPFASIHGYRRTGEESWSFRVEPKSAIGYLSLVEIKSSTLLELRKIEPMMRAEGVRAVVLDLRFTTGQDLRHAALLADGLVDGGILWRVRDKRGRAKEYKADRDCLFRDMPLAVLVGEYTSSLPAIVTAAFQDRRHALVVGEIPKAELTVSSLLYLPEERGAVRLQTGRVERIKGAATTELQRQADSAGRLLPDHIVAIERKALGAVQEWRMQQESPEPKSDAKAPADPQLDKAVTLLRAALAQREKKEQP